MIDIKEKGLDKASSDISKIMESLEKLPEEMQEEVIVKDSNFTDTKNIVNTGRISDTDEDAINEARYVAARLHEPFNENGVDDDEIEKAEEEIVNRFMRDYIDNIFG